MDEQVRRQAVVRIGSNVSSIGGRVDTEKISMVITLLMRRHSLRSLFGAAMLIALTFASAKSEAQQKELGEVTILTAVSNMAFSAL
jgi:hypothetical protein